MTQLEQQLTSQQLLPKRDSSQLATGHRDREVDMFSAGHKTAEEKSTSHDEDVIGWFDWVAENAAAVQAETLRRIVEANCGTEYLARWLGKEGLIRLEDLGFGELEKLYTSLVPISSHVELEPYIQRIADGDTRPILTRDPITTLSLSSGTTDGRPKYIPFTRFSAQSTLQLFKLAAAHRAMSDIPSSINPSLSQATTLLN